MKTLTTKEKIMNMAKTGTVSLGFYAFLQQIMRGIIHKIMQLPSIHYAKYNNIM